MVPTYFYIDGCGYCERVLPEIAELFAAKSIQLVIRKPTIVEKPAIKGYPALLLPRGEGPPLLLIGTGILDALRERPDLWVHREETSCQETP